MTLEQIVYDGFQSVFGDTAVLGILVLSFFGIFVLLQNTRFDMKVVIMVPAAILAAAFLPWMMVVLALVLGGIIYLAIMKFDAR